MKSPCLDLEKTPKPFVTSGEKSLFSVSTLCVWYKKISEIFLISLEKV